MTELELEAENKAIAQEYKELLRNVMQRLNTKTTVTLAICAQPLIIGTWVEFSRLVLPLIKHL